MDQRLYGNDAEDVALSLPLCWSGSCTRGRLTDLFEGEEAVDIDAASTNPHLAVSFP
jgi:hypothetical protein